MNTVSPLHIAILGTRGVPARYGGFETFAEELSLRLLERGHQVTVYTRRKFFERYRGPDEYQGVKIRAVPTIMSKYFETPLSGIMSFLDLFWRRYDVILLCNGANSPAAWPMLFLKPPLYINVDGIERKRSKWGLVGKLGYLLGEVCSVCFATRIVADADMIADYYRENYRSNPVVIRYGATPCSEDPGETLQKFQLQPGKYILYVSRLEPENNALGVIRAYNQLQTDLPLVVVGDAPYASSYKKQLQEEAGEKVIFTGFQFGKAYRELRTHCQVYIQATEVGGTHPALVEAMASGNAIIANDVPEHREVLQDCGLYYPKNNFEELARELDRLLGDQQLQSDLRGAAKAHAAEEFSWDHICDQYEQLFSGEK